MSRKKETQRKIENNSEEQELKDEIEKLKKEETKKGIKDEDKKGALQNQRKT